MNSIPVTKFKAECCRVLEQISATGESIVVTVRGKPIAMICAVPKTERQPWKLGMFEHLVTIVGDVMLPFDEPWDTEWEPA